jgi:hypothetical protein
LKFWILQGINPIIMVVAIIIDPFLVADQNSAGCPAKGPGDRRAGMLMRRALKGLVLKRSALM